MSCVTAFESLKYGSLTPSASNEELERYATQQELLARVSTPEEASQISRLSHSESMEALANLSKSDSMPTLGGEDDPEESKLTKSKRRSFRRRPKVFERIVHAIGNKLHNVEGFMFPHRPKVGGSSVRQLQPPTPAVTPKVKGGVLLRGCIDDDEHKMVVRQSIAIMKEMRGEEGLRAVGFEYRDVPVDSDATSSSNDDDGNDYGHMIDPSEATETMARLFHAESNTAITLRNRKEFIADGDMYDQVARLCQEYAQEVMIKEGDLEWVTVCDAGNNPEPIRALVSKSLSKNEEILDKEPTLLIATGKGKVRAGIFSRQHLITSGMECSTALPIVREAQKRKMNCVLLDPNVHGDRLGMATFEKSMARIFRRWESDEVVASADKPPLANRDLYVLSHSQSGAQFARYLLDKSSHYVPHIRAIAFTDSTHNIQWTKDKQDLNHLLQSDKSVYFKVSKDSQDDVLKPLATTGKPVDTDHFWEHRFGNIQTKCAGTTEHSLTNWFAHTHIWDHFDKFLHGRNDNQ